MKQIFKLGLAAFLVLGSGSLSAERKERKTQGFGSESAHAPPAAREWRNPYAGQPDAVLAGKKLYARHCAQCHAEDGRGRGKALDLRSPPVQDAPSGVLFWYLKNGNIRKSMPSWSRLPDQQLWQLVSFLQTPR